jgi:hypothetical protein
MSFFTKSHVEFGVRSSEFGVWISTPRRFEIWRSEKSARPETFCSYDDTSDWVSNFLPVFAKVPKSPKGDPDRRIEGGGSDGGRLEKS